MAHPELDNRTPFAFEPLFLADEDGRPVVAPIVKATLAVDADGTTRLAEEQLPVSFEGDAYGSPGETSYRMEPEVAFTKPGTDVVLVGHAHAETVGAGHVDVEFRVGPVGKWVRVWGDRFATGSRASAVSDPQPFELMPLTFERAFGGWDRSADDEAHHDFEARNPVGVGFRAKHGKVVEGDPWPNLEDPYDPVGGLGTKGKPAGFGFLSPDWQPRAAFAGTYDEAWTRDRAPLLPKDFDRRFFNAASEGMVATPHLSGTEEVAVRNATPEGYWAFRLPGIANPRCVLSPRRGSPLTLETALDTVVVDADARHVVLLWRAFTHLAGGPLDLRAITVASDNVHKGDS